MIHPLFGKMQSFYVFQHAGEWRAVVFEEAQSVRHFLMYSLEGEIWRRLMGFGSRENERCVAEVTPLHFPIACVYCSLMTLGNLMAAVEQSVHVWVVVYHMEGWWRMVTEYLNPSLMGMIFIFYQKGRM
jgi:hypothetical protein